MNTVIPTSRRRFLKISLVAGAGAGLVLGLHLPLPALMRTAAANGPVFEPNAFLRITPDNTVTVISKHLEMGQGIYTGLATIVAEELDADWQQIRIEGAPADAARYNNLHWGTDQGTGGSCSIANSWEQLRRAGATARALLVQAAAEQWRVPATEIEVDRGILRHAASEQQATFGELAEYAAGLPMPQNVTLKPPEDFIYIGKAVPRKDSPAKTNGSAVYTQDFKLPGMLTAVVAHAPRFGATVKRFDATAAKAVAGVDDVLQIPSGVAVLARDFWTAQHARSLVDIEWDESTTLASGSAEIMAHYKALARQPGVIVRSDGDAVQALSRADRTLRAEFEFPFLAHAPMEPLNCVMQLTDDGCEVWNGEQLQTADQENVAAVFGIGPHQVSIHMLYAGGSFGRRANPVSDYLVETAHIVRAIGGRAPVKLMWTREDDTRSGFFRPMYYHTLEAALDENGQPLGWRHHIVGQSLLKYTRLAELLIKDGIDGSSVEGAVNTPYALPNLQLELTTSDIEVPVLWWRSVGSSHTAFAIETFIDELAAAAGQDPIEFRRPLLAAHPRHLAVLDLAVANSDWDKPLEQGRGRGFAIHETFDTVVAQIVEVSVERRRFHVDRVICALDCGTAINPDVITAQIEGGIGYALNAALYGEITLEQGRVRQSNFHDYRPLRIYEMPQIDVHIVASDAPPTGVGEPGVPPLAPALANALAAATGQRLRRLPLRLPA